MVIMETIVVATSLCLLYRYMNGIIDDSLYRVHLTEATPLWQLLMKAAAAALGAFVVANGVFLLIAVAVWGRYVNSIMARFMAAVRHAGKLDFRFKPAAAHRHEVMALTEMWLSQERRRIGAIRDEIARLEAAAATDDREALARGVKRLLDVVHPVIDGRATEAPDAREKTA
ncbi:MAG TPA: hypothetical protein VF801_07785 [Rhodocyclaceae bacterium]